MLELRPWRSIGSKGELTPPPVIKGHGGLRFGLRPAIPPAADPDLRRRSRSGRESRSAATDTAGRCPRQSTRGSVAMNAGNVPTFASVASACAVAADAEVANIALYDALLALELPTDVRTVFVNNRRASLEAHLPAFNRCR